MIPANIFLNVESFESKKVTLFFFTRNGTFGVGKGRKEQIDLYYIPFLANSRNCFKENLSQWGRNET